MKNQNAKLHFPVFLDSYERFRLVHQIGNTPNKSVFLLNKENEIILVGQPFSPLIKEKYINIISGNIKFGK